MARINIEDSLFKHNGFTKLLLKLGSRRAALGALVEAFMLAQEHFLSDASERLIPLSEWKRQEIADEIIESGLAEVREKGIYVFGSNEQFAWLLQKQNAGRKGGIAKAHANDLNVAGASGCLAFDSGSKPPTLPLPLSLPPSLDPSHSQKQIHVKKTRVAKAPVVSEFNLESIYEAYPKRDGGLNKKGGLAFLSSKIATAEHFEKAKAAVNNYAKFCELKGWVKTSYVKQFSTFFGKDDPWLEFVAYEAPAVSHIQSKQTLSRPTTDRTNDIDQIFRGDKK
jgi:hypothetical protein